MGREAALAETSEISHRIGFTLGRAFHVGPAYFVRLREQLKIAYRASHGGLHERTVAATSRDLKQSLFKSGARVTSLIQRGCPQRLPHCYVTNSAICTVVHSAAAAVRGHPAGQRFALRPSENSLWRRTHPSALGRLAQRRRRLAEGRLRKVYLRGEGCAAQSCSAPVL